jgi:hypothetical protein
MMASATSTSSRVKPRRRGVAQSHARTAELIEIERHLRAVLAQFHPARRLHPFARQRQPQRRRIGGEQHARAVVAAGFDQRQPGQRLLPAALAQQVVADDQLSLARAFEVEAIAAQIGLPDDRLLADARLLGRGGEQPADPLGLARQLLARVGRDADADERNQDAGQHDHHQ